MLLSYMNFPTSPKLWKYSHKTFHNIETELPWPGSSVGYSVVPIHESCGSDLQPGHIQKLTNECINCMEQIDVSLSPFSLSKKNQ